MLSKAVIKLIRSLDTRKGRRKEGLFVAEGPKLVLELWGRYDCVHLIATEKWMAEQPVSVKQSLVEVVDETELQRASLQQSPQQVIAIFRIPPAQDFSPTIASEQLCLALDGVQDPGNLGTIIRLADWFGVEHVCCSIGTADIWNPKAVQATMGGLARVSVHYVDLPQLLTALPLDIPVYGTSLQGDNIWQTSLSAKGFIVMGNEGNGVSPEVDALCNSRLLIPNYPLGRTTTDSLNVAMATGITLAEFRRRTQQI